MEDYNNLAEGAFSAEATPEGSSKQNEETASDKKTTRKKASKTAAEPVQAEKPNTGSVKKEIKKASAKKATAANAETTESKPVKAKKAATKKAQIKQLPVEEEPAPAKQNVVIIEPVPEQQSVSSEHTVTLLPSAEPLKQELTPSPDEEPVAETQTGETEKPEVEQNEKVASNVHVEGEEKLDFAQSEEPTVESVVEEQVPARSTEKSEEGPETATTFLQEQNLQTEEQSLNDRPKIESSQESSSDPAKSVIRKITFQIRFHTKVGQSLFVTGNHALLGNNATEDAFPLDYLSHEYWSGTLDIPAGIELSEDISYNYILKENDNIVTEWGQDKVIDPLRRTTKEILLVDSWNSSSLVENTFYTEPFQKVLLKNNYTETENKQPQTITHIFRVKAPLLTKDHVLCITGSVPELGEWNTADPLLLSRKEEEVWHTISLDLTNSLFPVTYKYGVYDINTRKFLGFEDGPNRVLYDEPSADKQTVVSDGYARLPYNSFRGAGVAIPVFSLRSDNSFGVGEFNDLKLLVDLAKKVGLKLIQILPVNDTTATHTFADSYPYAAISAFALHPLYLHLPSIVDSRGHPLLSSFHEKQLELNDKPEVDYIGVMAAKWSFIKQVFASQKQQVFQSDGFTAFFNENAHWLIPYAVFCYFREKYNTSDFNKWPTNQVFAAEEISRLASSPLDADEEISLYFFVQFHLHLQLQDAADYAHQNGIILKGDIPIGIYRYSCDAWQEPSLFNMDMQAGAPPDNFVVKGQNWGFPTYNWHRMREDGFTWWKKRFTQMSYYFDAFRIDHILGFFRIWSIPMHSVEGIMGHFVPAVPVRAEEFAERGVVFNPERLTKPFINDSVLQEIFENNREIIREYLDTSPDGNYSLKPGFDTQLKVEAYFSSLENTDENKKIKSGLFDLISNVILFEAEGSEGKEFHFRISMDNTLSFKYLDGYTQHQLKELYLNYYYRRQDSFWMKEAMLKLPELKRSTNMLICGEDLGMVPASVPGVMKELAILSLEIQRMPKDPAREFFHPNDAPYLSVVTPSTHDMSTIRGWWEEDRAATQRFFINELGRWGTAPYFCEPWINKIIVVQHLYSPAMWSIFQLQDLMGIDAKVRRENPHEERINIPADPKHYWRYRMHLSLEKLIKETEFTSELKNLIAQSGR